MDKKSKISIAIVGIVVVILAGLAVYFGAGITKQNQSQNQSQTTNSQTSTSQAAPKAQTSSDSKIVSYEGKAGQTAIEILKSNYIVETKAYAGIGEMVIAIDNVKPRDSSEFWAFYVDGKQAQVGADQYITKDGEKIEWKLEAVQ